MTVMMFDDRSSQTDSNKSAIFEWRGFRNNLLLDAKDDYCTRPDNGLGHPKMPLCNRRVCTWPQNLSLLLSHTDRLKTTSFPLTEPAPAASCHCRAASFTQLKHNDFWNNSLERAVCVPSLFFTVTSLSLRSVVAGCPARFWHDSCPTVWGLSAPTWGKQGGDYFKKKRERERESVDLCNVKLTVLLCKFFRLQGGDSVRAAGKRKDQRYMRTQSEPDNLTLLVSPQCPVATVSTSHVLRVK